MTPFPCLASPLAVGPWTLPNRLVQTGHATAMADHGVPGEQLAAYYGERARGGVAMIVTEAQSVHPTAAHMAQTVEIYNPAIVDAYRRISADLHAAGTRFVAQLWHCGNNTDSMVIDRAAWSASAVAGPLNHEIPHAVSTEEIGELVRAYADGAAAARAGGADGIEIHMGHGYLPQQFLSRITNHREDGYGGSDDRRLRFPLEILAAVAEAAGPELAIGIRLSGEEGVPGGLGVDETAEIARRLCATGAVAYVSVSYGTYANMEIQTAPMGTPAGHLAPLAAAIRAAIDVPVLAAGRMLSPDVGERLVAGGAADLIGMARELICDPEFAAKALSGRADEIRPCIGCNYCQSRLWAGRHVTCVHNPAAGRERELGRATARRATEPRDVLVVGGGPAGMEAAIVAARAGHRVRLCEQGDELGGQLRFAALPASRAEVRKVIDHRVGLLEELAVDVELGVTIEYEALGSLSPDVVVLATGSTPRASAYPGASTSWDVLVEPPASRESVVIVDLEGHVQGLAVADFLLDAGHAVHLVTPHPFAGMHIGGTAWVRLMQLVTGKGAVLSAATAVTSVRPDGTVELAGVFGAPPWTLNGIDRVVVCGDAGVNDSLLAPLRERTDVRTIAVGDCVAPRHLDMAILEGHRAGRSV
ncbi:MAG: FAD-dependent oxidoreductase [Solirubrobacteraceae bacterium]